MFEFRVEGKPTGKARPRVTRWSVHNTDTTVIYENLIKIMFMQKYKRVEPLKGCVRLELTIIFKPAKSTSKKKSLEMLQGKIKPSKKPDIDNIVKIYADALNKVAYDDDTQIVELVARKTYGNEDVVIVKIDAV